MMVDLAAPYVPYVRWDQDWAIYDRVVLGWRWLNDSRRCRLKRALWCKHFHSWQPGKEKRRTCRCCTVGQA